MSPVIVIKVRVCVPSFPLSQACMSHCPPSPLPSHTPHTLSCVRVLVPLRLRLCAWLPH